ncbi:MAG: hypothetical protein Kow0037_14100 [Calditrichia bacterium]
MENTIFAFIGDPALKAAVENIRQQLRGPVKFFQKLTDLTNVDPQFQPALVIYEYALLRSASDEERKLFYSIKAPRLLISLVDGQLYGFAVTEYVNLGKPTDLETDKLVRVINENYYPKNELTVKQVGQISFVTNNKKMKQIYENCLNIAQYDTQVLLLGETGTGKDVLARLIHENSRRSDNAFVKLNCAAIPSNLLESELFGYRKGAFTNAFEDKPGKLQLANGGTMFLDEIGEMALGLQAKLLRVIETGEVDVLGSNMTEKVNIRLISATNRNLAEEVAKGNFRADLYYRLNVVSFYLPPLRERLDDVPALFKLFLDEFCRKYNKYVERLENDALRAVYEYDWPGNIREFRHFVERLVLGLEDRVIDRKNVEAELNLIKSGLVVSGKEYDLSTYMELQERQYILKMLAKHDFKVLETARALGIDRATFYRKTVKYGIDVQSLKKDIEL